MVASSGYHPGELAVQRLAGVTGQAARLAGMVGAGQLSGGLAQFLAGRTFAALSAHDRDGTPWVSPLIGEPGFLDAAGPTTLHVRYRFLRADPLHDLPTGQPVGLVVMEFAIRRRARINGTLLARDGDMLTIGVEQAYGNCPQYIQSRHTVPATSADDGPVRMGETLAAPDIALIRSADTFFLGTHHPTHGSDASHRGGTKGFVRVEDDGTLWWPDYPGNNMFNSLGNLAENAEAALLFVDFTTGTALHLTGRAEVAWTDRSIPGDDGATGRRVEFTPHRYVAHAVPVHSTDIEAYRDNPPLTTPETVT
jgi:predicted pyridoxine 5'-phosphate oxidase superfamily flavin-nucleotide-binding protein